MKLIHAVYEPAGPGPHPTIIAFHGWGANALDLLGLAPHLCGGRFLTICPQGPLEVPLGPMNGYGWFPLNPGSPPDSSAIKAGADAAASFIEEAFARYPVEPQKIGVIGFSQGGVMAYSVALMTSRKFAAIAGLSTWFPDTLSSPGAHDGALAHMPVLVQHGAADNLIEIGRARESAARIRQLGADVRYREYDCGHEITAPGLSDLSIFLDETVLRRESRP
ncbi:MAG: alpha/beta hydrolase [Candidatus Binataceae bacterium]